MFVVNCREVCSYSFEYSDLWNTCTPVYTIIKEKHHLYAISFIPNMDERIPESLYRSVHHMLTFIFLSYNV